VIAVVTNIDREHLDHYGSFENLRESFLKFVKEVPFYGLDVMCTDCSVVRGMIGEVDRRYITYGASGDAELRAIEIFQEKQGAGFDVVHQGRKLGRIVLGVPGRHNAINALAAIAVSFELGVDFDTIVKSLTGFKGVHRRFEIKGEARGVTVVDDYGHHPSEIKATLAAARDWRPEQSQEVARRVIVGFQPHRYTRTKILFDEFATAFDQAEVLLITEIYSAGEDPIAGVTGKALFEEVCKHRRGHGLETVFCPGLEEMEAWLEKSLRPGDLFLTVGAGNIWQAGEEILKRIKG
jgi:UDP-N-acetylmuramate--alanine ligase